MNFLNSFFCIFWVAGWIDGLIRGGCRIGLVKKLERRLWDKNKGQMSLFMFWLVNLSELASVYHAANKGPL